MMRCRRCGIPKAIFTDDGHHLGYEHWPEPDLCPRCAAQAANNEKMRREKGFPPLPDWCYDRITEKK